MNATHLNLNESRFLWALLREAPFLWLRDVVVDANVNVTYTPASGNSFVSISGHGRVLRDVMRQKRLWLPQWQARFPLGPSDPTLRLFEVDIEMAQLLGVQANSVLSLLSPAAAPVHRSPASTRAAAPGVYARANG